VILEIVMKRHLKKNSRPFVILSILLLSFTVIVFVKCKDRLQETSGNLENGFLNPPESAKPLVYWFCMDGNITREGIKADLEWMKRVGIGGFQIFDIGGMGTPQIVGKRLAYMTSGWKDAFLFATKMADSLDLEMTVAGSPGWSESGGPWVTPSQAMKKLVWSKIRVEGGQPFTRTLPKPPTTTGIFQNIGLKGVEPASIPEYYADVAVLAYRIPENDIQMAELHPKVTSSGGKFDLTALIDDDLSKNTFLPAGALPDRKSWLQFEFAKPVTIKSVTLVAEGCGGNSSGSPVGSDDFILDMLQPGHKSNSSRSLEASNDGIKFNTVLDLTKPYYYTQIPQITATFPATSARFFRVTFTSPPLKPGDKSGSKSQETADPLGTQIAEFVLHTTAMVNRFEDKAGFTAATGLYALATPSVPASDAISKDDVVDLTSKMHPDGTLNWTPPAGHWVILRLGYSLTGRRNGPASPEATGLEVDKLNRDHVKAYFENYLDKNKDATGGLMGRKGLKNLSIDSWEAGVQNWTDSMMTEFTSRRGYNILPWLPVLTGCVVESAESSDRFLWDFRKTISDLTAENHYDQLTTLLHKRGMGRYSEAHETARGFIGDGMEVKRKADVPQSASWVPGGLCGSKAGEGLATVYKADVRESASVAHIYGQNLVAAESFTTEAMLVPGSGWSWSPESLKPTADMELTSGLNRFVIHCSVHQPVFDKIPGIGLGTNGQWFTRNETWSEQAVAWTTYLARCSYMLQQGKFVADVIYFYGEDCNITALFENKLPDVPPGYNYDFVNADALVNMLSVNKGQIITPSGMSYRVLALDPNSKYMSLPVLRKINEMVKAGAVIVGDKPVNTPSLTDNPDEFKILVNQLWGTGTGENAFGRGKVYAGQTIAEVLSSLKVIPDFEYTESPGNTELLYVHRKLDDVDIYWVNNRNDKAENLNATFRVVGKVPEVWHPESGEIEEISYNISEGHTTVPLKMEPNDAVFVVFRKKSATSSLTLTQLVETQPTIIDGAWNVSFQPDRGAPAQIVLDKLTSWSENTDPGVKYFSGTASYTKTIKIPGDWFKKGTQIWLDLGDVKNLAEVVVNGKSLGIVWKTPFRVNVTEPLKEGENLLEVKVTNLWVNRLIGDQQPGNMKKITYTTRAFFQANSHLLPSGLLGPVKIVRLSKN
jgi:hypothetical protein